MPLSNPEPRNNLRSLVELLRWRTEQQPAAQAAAFVGDDPGQTTTFSYAALDRRAQAIAVALQEHGAQGERALLLFAPGLEFVSAFFGCLYAGTVAVPTYPPRTRSLGRVQGIIDDAQPRVILTTADIRALVEPLIAETPGFPPVRWLVTDEVTDDLAAGWRDPGVDRHDLAFLQYTSGSTATPRGVMVSHGNLLHNLALIRAGFDTHPGDPGVIWLPLYHDMGLIGGVLQPIFTGMPVTLMSPLTFLQRPFRWLEAISRTGARVSGGPNFAYDLCVRKITPEQRATLDLNAWEAAFTGAEPVRAETIELFTKTFAPCGFRREAWYPCYGLAEATLFVSGIVKGSGPRYQTVSAAHLEKGRALPPEPEDVNTRTLVSCGQGWLDLRIAIVDPETCLPCAAGVVGEIWTSSPSVAGGYWARAEENETIFRARLANDSTGTWLRTGDLGYMDGDDLFITGRIKDLIIVDGRNHYPQDIELTVEAAHPAIRPSFTAAFSVDGPAGERLVVAAELERDRLPGRPAAADPAEVLAAVRQAITRSHEIQLHDLALIRTNTILKTSSGKIQRRAARAQYLAGELVRVDGK